MTLQYEAGLNHDSPKAEVSTLLSKLCLLYLSLPGLSGLILGTALSTPKGKNAIMRSSRKGSSVIKDIRLFRDCTMVLKRPPRST